MQQIFFYKSPIGHIELISNGENITKLEFVSDSKVKKTQEPDRILKQCIRELDEYFAGKRKDFSVSTRQDGTEFQKKAWHALTHIPYGETRSYAWEAETVGNKAAVRAIGSANGANNIAIIIPCHRVISSSGALSGYGGEVWRKEWLLTHEKKHATLRSLLDKADKGV